MKKQLMSDFVEWNPKHHGHKPLHWTPDMLTSVDGKNFARQPNWAWIAGSTYYVPHEAVGMVREAVEPEPVVTDADRIEALTTTLRYEPAQGSTLEEMRDNLSADLRQTGDCKLVWVNEGDLALLDIPRAALEKQP
jgi:hypothetical protein